MKRFFNKVWTWIKRFVQKITPGPVAQKGAFKAIATTAIVFWIIASLVVFVIEPGTYFGLIPVVLGPIIGFLVSAGTVLAIGLIKKLPKKFFWYVPGAFFLSTFIFNAGQLGTQFPLFMVVFSGLSGAGLYTLLKRNRALNTLAHKITAGLGLLIGLAGLVWGITWLADTGFEPDPEHINAALKSEYRPEKIDLPNPGEPGPYKVMSLSYGSGKDKHRPEFGEEVDIVTDSVDGSRLIDNWKKLSGKIRTWYWGHDDKALPLNGRVWYPEGDGPFPLALIVHGNHSMYDYSDGGYEYLGELLASHGIIMVSVDENFINSGWSDLFGDGLSEENDARGWLLLEHLRVWRQWNEENDNAFFSKVDMDNIAVMGHSRGGEAAAVAGFFNKLKYYPDNAKQEFDFGFNIKSVVAIAPVDGQYDPGESETPLEDLNYLVIHGANDGDVQSFAGLRQYERVKFSDSTDFFKSAVYVYGANHGQFNTSWGNRDAGMPYGSLLNVDALMPMEEQLQVGKTYISAFLQATLQSKTDYRHLFEDYRSGIDWLPETIYLNQFEASNWQYLADFEEDLDLTTTSHGDSISGENLTVWREQLVSMKWGNKGTRAAYLGWDSLAYEADTARYTFHFKEPLNAESLSTLSFELSESKEGTYPDKERDEEAQKNNNGENNSNVENEDVDSANEEEEEKSEEEEEEDDDKPKAKEPLDFRIELTDESGHKTSFLLSDYSYLQRQITVDVLKNPELQDTKTSEAIYNTFMFNLRNLIDSNTDFDLKAIRSLSFVFDQSPKGVIILDKLSMH
ncbi:alpha/beta hydrolase family protein [Roseivirga sp.]|uniref:alpha/beta hydrolase family protein n=1 Tax=Roseivirga sp. TaxID=1964215 RepID=UPI003B525DFB